ncbi:hypothetical protein [Halodesulfovibrio spirochaetisodalis]|uniref:hypothetical protein n=1 Tax=Halodesulfovibrio spirochaetisodalis TaxID=1560234 RepID=UPI000AC47E4D|nr:hypothetical protein [Halodesulfovibrio spirochaetisodalis]
MNLFKTLERLFVAAVYAESGDHEMADRVANEHKGNKRTRNKQTESARKRPQLRA